MNQARVGGWASQRICLASSTAASLCAAAMGTYRFLLACAVACAHLGLAIRGYTTGVVAVVSFFLLSGFVMTALVERHYAEWRLVPHFYLDRVFRLFPQYLFYVVVTLVVLACVKVDYPLVAGVTAGKVALNILMLPLAFYMWGLGDCVLIPPAWSLGLECCFYLVFPVLLIARAIRPVFVVSAGIFLLAYAGILRTDYFGYRLIFGTLFMFLCGALIFRSRDRRCDWWVVATWFVAVALLGLTYAMTGLAVPNNREVLLGLVIGLPAVWWLRKWESGRVDEWLGNLSYGLFLNHFIVIWLLQKSLLSGLAGWRMMLAVLVGGTALSFVSYVAVERPALKFRRRLRKKNATAGESRAA